MLLFFIKKKVVMNLSTQEKDEEEKGIQKIDFS